MQLDYHGQLLILIVPILLLVLNLPILLIFNLVLLLVQPPHQHITLTLPVLKPINSNNLSWVTLLLAIMVYLVLTQVLNQPIQLDNMH